MVLEIAVVVVAVGVVGKVVVEACSSSSIIRFWIIYFSK